MKFGFKVLDNPVFPNPNGSSHPTGDWSRLVCRGEKALLRFHLVQLCLRPLSLEQVQKKLIEWFPPERRSASRLTPSLPLELGKQRSWSSSAWLVGWFIAWLIIFWAGWLIPHKLIIAWAPLHLLHFELWIKHLQVGGVFSAVAGSGVDICSFSVLSLLFRWNLGTRRQRSTSSLTGWARKCQHQHQSF